VNTFIGGTESNKLLINHDGNVGIGTDTPGAKLDVNGNITLEHAGVSTESGQISMVGSRAVFGYDGSIYSAFMRSSDTSKPLVFGAGASELMRIASSSGNVGIGTTTPGAKLEISSADNVAAILNSSNTFTFLDFEKNGANRVQIGNASDGDFIIRTSEAERMRITSAGNVGIGTDTPGAKLDVESEILISGTDPILRMERGDGFNSDILKVESSTDNLIIGDTSLDDIIFESDSGEAMRILASGNVGIGTDNPVDKLSVRGSAGTNSISVLDPILDSRRASMGLDPLENGFVELRRDNNTIYTYLGSSGNSYINGGNVGIGTSSPGYKLDVAGDARLNGVTFVASGATRSINSHSSAGLLRLSGGTSLTDGAHINIAGNAYSSGDYVEVAAARTYITGNVGIGTTTPTEKLEVDGGVKILGKLNVSDDIQLSGARVIRNLNNHLYLDSAPTKQIYLRPEGTTALALSSAGANFSSSISATDGLFSGNVGVSANVESIKPLLTLSNNISSNDSSAGVSIDFVGSSDITAIGSRIIATRASAGANMDLRFHTARDIEALRLNSDQSAIFASSVSATDGNFSGNLNVDEEIFVNGSITSLGDVTSVSVTPTALTTGKIPYKSAGALVDSPISTDGADVIFSGDLESNNANFNGNVQAGGYKSSDGSAGLTTTVNVDGGTELVFKNGLLIAVNVY
tara:strand:- start:305 stop:2380 length:2076 start_codon:yes stop_codon:yes gene_type:complete